MYIYIYIYINFKRNKFTREFGYFLLLNNLKANSLEDLFILKYLLFSVIGPKKKNIDI